MVLCPAYILHLEVRESISSEQLTVLDWHAGLSYARWSTEAISAREFSQYEYYMQPRIHTIMSQARQCAACCACYVHRAAPLLGLQPCSAASRAHFLP